MRHILHKIQLLILQMVLILLPIVRQYLQMVLSQPQIQPHQIQLYYKALRILKILILVPHLHKQMYLILHKIQRQVLLMVLLQQQMLHMHHRILQLHLPIVHIVLQTILIPMRMPLIRMRIH